MYISFSEGEDIDSDSSVSAFFPNMPDCLFTQDEVRIEQDWSLNNE